MVALKLISIFLAVFGTTITLVLAPYRVNLIVVFLMALGWTGIILLLGSSIFFAPVISWFLVH